MGVVTFRLLARVYSWHRILEAWCLSAFAFSALLHPYRAASCQVVYANVSLVPPTLRALHTLDAPSIIKSIVNRVHTLLVRHTYTSVTFACASPPRPPRATTSSCVSVPPAHVPVCALTHAHPVDR